MESITSSNLEDLERLINSGRLEEAVAYADSYLKYTSEPISAHFWFARGLIATLLGEDPKEFWMQATDASGYNTLMEADFRLDNLVLGPLRAGVKNKKPLDDELSALIPLYSGHPNHIAKLMMAKGRVEFAKGNLQAASVQHRVAENVFQLEAHLGRVNETWRRNNVYHRFRTERSLISFFKRSHFDLVWSLYEQVRRDPARRRSHLFGPLILITGRFGCRIEDLVLKSQSRRFA